MKKEYIKITREILDENMISTGEVAEKVWTRLTADTGKLIKDTTYGILGTSVEIGANDSEDNYIEVDNPNYTEVIDAIVDEVAK